MAFETTITVKCYWRVIINKRAPTGLSRASQRYSLQNLTLHNNLWLNAIFIIHTESCLPYFMRPSCRGEAEIWDVKVDECGQQNVRVGGDTWYPLCEIGRQWSPAGVAIKHRKEECNTLQRGVAGLRTWPATAVLTLLSQLLLSNQVIWWCKLYKTPQRGAQHTSERNSGWTRPNLLQQMS